MTVLSHAQNRLTTATVNPIIITWLTGVPGAVDSAGELEVLLFWYINIMLFAEILHYAKFPNSVPDTVID